MRRRTGAAPGSLVRSPTAVAKYRRSDACTRSPTGDVPDPVAVADGPAPGTPLSSAIYSLARAHRAYAATLLRDLGLHPGQDIVLLELAGVDRRSQADIVRSLMLDHSTVAKSLRRLETAGLIARSPSAGDRRAVDVRLTARGRDLLERIGAAWARLEEATVRQLSPAQQATAVRLMRRIEQSVIAEEAARSDRRPSRSGALHR